MNYKLNQLNIKIILHPRIDFHANEISTCHTHADRLQLERFIIVLGLRLNLNFF